MNLLADAREPQRPLDDEEFDVLTKLLLERTGLLFPQQKRRELDAKISTHLRETEGLERDDFIRRIKSSDAEFQRFVDRVTIGESYFFRNRPHFSALTAEIIPELIAANAISRKLRIWSAGCSTGEEPYSLAIALRESFPDLAGWDIRILATDINRAFLERAKKAIYTRWSFRGLEERIIDKYFVPEGTTHFKLREDVAKAVEFDWFNLARTPFSGRILLEPFDLVLCRNVLIYFTFDLASRIVRELSQTLRPNGFLVVGHAESFPTLRELESVYSRATYYYRRRDPSLRREEPQKPRRAVSIPGIPVHEESYLPVDAAPSAPSPPSGTRARAGQRADGKKRMSSASVPLPELETARSLAEAGELSRAETIVDELAAKAGKLDFRVHFLRALVADKKNMPGEAIASLRQAIFLHREFAIAHYFMGIICEREGDAKTARRCFKNASEIAQRLPEDEHLEEGGGTTAKALKDMAAERIRELELE